jgi:heme-degrading monooxygenase HmoA
MVLEHAVLQVVPGEEMAFEAEFREAADIISTARGFRSLRLERCLEVGGRYVLLVEWDTLEDHTDGFRGSPEYGQWAMRLHRFYEPFPIVDHYEPVLSR